MINEISMSTLCQCELTTDCYTIPHHRPGTRTSTGEFRGSTTWGVPSTGRRFSAQHPVHPPRYHPLRTHCRSWSLMDACIVVQLFGGYSIGRKLQSRIECHNLSARAPGSSIEEKY